MPPGKPNNRRGSPPQFGALSRSVRHVQPNRDFLIRQASSMREPGAVGRSRANIRSRSRSPRLSRDSYRRRQRRNSNEPDGNGSDSSDSKSVSGSSETSDLRSEFGAEERNIFEDFNVPKSWYSLEESSRDDSLPDAGPRDEGERLGNSGGRVNGGHGKTQVLRVFSTKYTGSAELFGAHSAVLGSIHDPKGQRQPLFRWLHIQQEMMNFDEFWVTIPQHVHVSKQDANTIARLKAKVKKQCARITTNLKGSRVGYMEPRHVEVPLRPQTSRAVREDDTKARWICLPYFSLRPYSGLLAGSDASTFPNQTLLQTLYSRNKKDRDMEQAVCQLGTSPPGECFHVEQLWCLVLGNDLLVTCGAMERSTLENEVLEIVTEPSRQPSGDGKSGAFCVSYEDSTFWLLSTDECLTWFSFLLHFHELWPEGVIVKHKGKAVNAENWPEILDLAKRCASAVRLDLRTQSTASRGGLGALKATSSSDEEQKHDAEFLHVFALSSEDPKKRASNTLPDDLKPQLSAADKFLLNNTSSSLRTAYKNGKTTTRQAIYATLIEALGQDKGDNERRRLDRKIELFNAADDLFQFFFPASFEGPTTGKFWGAVDKMLESEQKTRQRSRGVVDGGNNWKLLTATSLSYIRMFQGMFSHANELERSKIQVPSEFLRAWLYALSGTIDCASTGQDRKLHFDRCEGWLKRCMQKTMDDLGGTSLQERALMLPMEVASLISLKLLKDQVAKSDDITETYTQYLNSLDIDIAARPSEKPYQQLLNLVQQELTAVKGTLMKQQQVIENIRKKLPAMDCPENILYDVQEPRLRHTRHYRSTPYPYNYSSHGRADNYYPQGELEHQDHYNPHEESRRPMQVRRSGYYSINADGVVTNQDFAESLDSAARLSPTDRGGFRALFILECSRFISQRELDVQRSSEFATELERGLTFKMSWVRDRQENAIFAFTIVTIIFLPLSSVAGIFGMNTTDVRDMPCSQWVYWAVAIPVTAVVIIGGLWWMNELGNVVAWVTGKRSRRSEARYAGIISPQVLDGWAPVRPNHGEGDMAYVPELPAYDAVMAPMRRRDDYAPMYPSSPAPFPSMRRRTAYDGYARG